MKYTNKFELPQTVFDAVVEQEKEHIGADYSVTQLKKGAAEIALTMLHKDELERDISDSLNTLLGSAVHSILASKGNQENAEVYMEYKLDDVVISGTADLLEDDCTTDYKTCASWKVIYKDFDDWSYQLRAYNFLRLIKTGKLVLKGKIISFIKDHSPTQAERDSSYPQTPIYPIDFTFTKEEILSIPDEWKAKIHDVNEIIKGNFIPCTEEERWHDPDKWALMKKGRISAVKLYDSEEEAKAACTDTNLYVEHRKGKDKKCDKYCDVGRCGFCPYYNETHTKEKENG